LAAFRRVGAEFGGAPIAALAKLGEATQLYDLGRYAEARSVYESLLGSAATLAEQEGRVYEDLGFVMESLNDLPAALRRYEEMARLGEGAYRDIAQFHQARVLERQHQPARAKEVLHGLIERLQRARPNDPLSGSANSSVLEQAKALLHDIDPQDPLGRRSEVPSDPDAIMRMLERQTGRRLRGGGDEPPRPSSP
jgi:tetratricopeptide (TPR) repeat protein